MSVIRTIKNQIKYLKQYYRDSKDSSGSQIKLYNYQWKTRNPQDHWLSQFIVSRNLLPKNKKDSIAIFSVNGNHLALNLSQSTYKIFYTAENVHVPYSYWQNYADLLLKNKEIDLSIGFDYVEKDNYLRIPFWLMSMFPADADYKKIKSICEKLNKPLIDKERRKEFCAFICRDDYFGDRIKMLRKINQISEVHCAGRFMHNNDNLKLKYNDDKLEYLKDYRFNLCPENSNSEGYVTEKIFEAIYSGCIPIYWGSNNNPEPNILNQNAIILINNEDSDINEVQFVKELNLNNKEYFEFAQQNRLTDDAADQIYAMYIDFERKIREIIKT